MRSRRAAGGGVDRPRLAGDVVPGAVEGRGGAAVDGPGGREELVERHVGGAVAEDLTQGGDVGADDGRPAGQRLDRRQAEALVGRGEDEGARAGEDRGELVV